MQSLSGILVVSIEQAVAAPLCTARLANAGARVIKVERREGDFARNYDSTIKGESSYFTWLNQGKESIVLDFNKTEDRELLLAITDKADVFVQNLKPDSLEKYNLDSVSLRKRNSDLITCDISGFGEDKKSKTYKAYDLIVQAESGLLGVSGVPQEPGRIGISICDIGAGITSYTAVLEGLIRKYRGFGGSSFKTSLFGVASEWMTVPLAQHEYGGRNIKPTGLKHPSIAPYGAFSTKDEDLIIISIQNEREWKIFCKNILENGKITLDKRFSTNNMRVKNRIELDRLIQSQFSKERSEYLKEKLEVAAIAFGVVNDLKGLANHFAMNRQLMRTSSDQEVFFPSNPLKRSFLGEEEKQTPRAPLLGENTEYIKNEFTKT